MGKISTLVLVGVGLAFTACSKGGGSSGGASTPGGVVSLLIDTLGVVGHSPADDAVQIDVDAEITVEFDGVIAEECLAEPETWLRPAGSTTSVDGEFSTFNGGRSIRFRPAASLQAETDYTFQLSPLTCDDDGRLLEEDYSFTFRTFDSTPPNVTTATISPNATDIPQNVTVDVTFDEAIGEDSVAPETIYLRDVFGTTYATQTTVSGSKVTIDPDVLLPGDRAFVLVALGGNSGVEDRAGNPLQSSWSLSFRTTGDGIKPSMTSGWPHSVGNASPRIQPLLTFSDSMDPASVESASVQFRDEFSNVVTYGIATSPDQMSVRLVPTSPLITGRTYTINVVDGAGAVTDLSGNTLSSSGLIQFKVGTDDTDPAVQYASLQDGETRVSPNAVPTLTFDGSLEAARISDATVSLTDPAGERVAATVTAENSNARIRIEPLNDLPVGKTYTVRIAGGPDGIRDLAGNYMAADLVRTFTTSNDDSLPSMLITPINGSTAISRDSTISVVAHQPLDATTVGPSTVYLQDSIGNVLEGSVQLSRSNRVIRFIPNSLLQNGETYTFTLIGGKTGVREASGNWLGADQQSVFRISQSTDTAPPILDVSLNDTGKARRTGRVMPPFGFELTAEFYDPDTFNQDPASLELELSGPASIDADTIFAGATVTETTFAYRVPEDRTLPAGTYTLNGRLRDLSGNEIAAIATTFEVAEPSFETLPFDRTQVVWARFDLDRDGNGRADFVDDLIRLGLNEASDQSAINARMIATVRDGILARVHRLYERKINGGRRGVDSVPIRLSHRQPLGVPFMQISCGGFDPEGAAGRTFGDQTSGTLGRAFYDYRNEIVNDNNTGVNPGVGVFPSELWLFETDIHLRVYPSFVTTFARAFLPLAPDLGGTPFGSDPVDGTISDPSFQYATATSAERARYNVVYLAADQWATAIGTILAHEIGHSLGLVAPGRTTAELHGDESLHNEFAGVTDIMGAAVGYDGLVSLNYRFRDLNLAYLRHRMLLK